MVWRPQTLACPTPLVSAVSLQLAKLCLSLFGWSSSARLRWIEHTSRLEDGKPNGRKSSQSRRSSSATPSYRLCRAGMAFYGDDNASTISGAYSVGQSSVEVLSPPDRHPLSYTSAGRHGISVPRPPQTQPTDVEWCGASVASAPPQGLVPVSAAREPRRARRPPRWRGGRAYEATPEPGLPF